jgi:hypothetical protein
LESRATTDQRAAHKWFHRAHIATCIFIVVFALPGLGYVFIAAIRGDVLGAVTGAGVTLGSIGVGSAIFCGIRMATVIDANLRELTELRKRADAVDALLEQISPMVSQTESGANGDSETESTEEVDAFPRLVEEEGSGLTGDPKTPEPQDSETPETLRSAFRRCVYAGDFAGALKVGERIATSFPDSPMANQFKELRESLLWRSASNGSGNPGIAVAERQLRAGS